MRMFRRLGVGLRGLLRREEVERDLDDELQGYIEAAAAENMRTGMSEEEARRAALLAFGSTDAVKEEVRAVGWENRIEACWHDVRYAARMLHKNPGFTIVAVLTLALGIGVNVSLFSIVNTVLLQPLPFSDPSRLMMLWEGLPQLRSSRIPFSAPDFKFVERGQKSFVVVGALQNKPFDISGQGEPDRIIGARVSASIFPMLGVEPMLGRYFTALEDAPGRNVVILSYGLWQRRYGGRSDILGRTIDLERQPYTVVGVMPKRFVFPLPGPPANPFPAALWVPMAFTPDELQGWGKRYSLSVLARLRPDVNVEQARSEGHLLAQSIQAQYPQAMLKDFYGARLDVPVFPWQQQVAGPVQPLLLVLMAAVSMVLLIACANVATLLLSRAAARQREIAVRQAVGATHGRLLQQLLTESFLLALVGGGCGLLLAFAGKRTLLALAPANIPLAQQVRFDGVVLLFVLVVSCLTAVLFGLSPALHGASGAGLHQGLQEGSRSGTSGRARQRLQNAFVTLEFGLSVVLLVGAGLLLRSFGKLLQSDLGIQPDHVLTMSVPLPVRAYPQATQVRNLYQQLVDAVPDLLGVKAAGMAEDLPLRAFVVHTFQIEGRPEVGIPPVASESWVLGDYFSAIGIPLRAGRLFTTFERASAPRVVIVSQQMAKLYWPGQDPIGKRLRHEDNEPWMTVVGVVGDVNDAPAGRQQRPHIYIPFYQLSDKLTADSVVGEARSMNLAVRTQSDPASVASDVIAKIHSLDPDLAAADVTTMQQAIHTSLAGPRFNTSLLGVFAGLALFLAAMGIYGTLAYAVSQRKHEIGIRLALGATPGDVLRFVLGWGTRLACVGAVSGIVAALALTRLMSGLLYGVGPTDPTTFAAVVVLLLMVTLLACYIPAQRATRVDPMIALRCE